MNTFLIFLPIVVVMGIMVAIGFAVRKSSQKDRAVNFSKDYFIGGRSLGGFVFAMTVVATYVSVSSFVGGPGVAWNMGFGWVLLAMTQVLAIFPVMGVIGKKMAVIGRKIDAVTVIDVIRVRYQSNLLANVAAVSLVIFFCGTMTAQFMGGANIFAAAVQGMFGQTQVSLFGVEMNYNYLVGMFICAVVVIAFTSTGGFKAVALTDVFSAMIMLAGMGLIAYNVLSQGGGMENIMSFIAAEQPHMLQPTAGGRISIQLLISMWMLVGVLTIGLPQSLVRNMSYRSSKDLHRAMIYGTVIAGAMILGIHLLGVLSRAVIHELPGGVTTDFVIPHLTVSHLPPLMAGIAITAPLIAAISTISSLLLAASSSIIKDVYQHSLERKGLEVDQKKIGRLSVITTALIGIICVVIALQPPTIIVWVNMFAFGGLQTTFFWTFLLGFFWKRANLTGALMSMVGGVFAYCYFMANAIPVFGFHHIVVGIGVGFILFVVGSLLGRPTDEKVLKLFFPEQYPAGTKIEVPEKI